MSIIGLSSRQINEERDKLRKPNVLGPNRYQMKMNTKFKLFINSVIIFSVISFYSKYS